MRPAEVARRGADYLARHGVASPAADAEALLLGILQIDRPTLFTREAALSAAEATAFGRALCRRCTGTPLQHLTGTVGFRGLTLEVHAGVFVPRPETEVLVEVALDLLEGDEPFVVDLCTGAGAAALAIAHERPGARVVATDLSANAVALARSNARRLDLPVEVAQGDLFEPLPAEHRGRVDLVVANPPYVPREREEQLPPEVRAEPGLALFGDRSFSRRLIGEAAAWLGPRGGIAVEIDDTMGEQVAAAARAAGFIDVRVVADLAGRDRVVSGRTPG